MNYAENVSTAITHPFRDNAAEEQSAAHAPGVWRAGIYRHYAELEMAWRQLEAAGRCTVFQTYDWAACWYDAVTAHGAAEPLVTVVAKEGTGPAWILPLCLYRKRGLRIISFADLGVSDYAAPVMACSAPADKDEVRAMMKAVFDALPPCDLIYFQKLADQVEGAPNPLLSLDGIARFPADCHGIRLSGPWPALAGKIMQSRLRSTIRRQKKRLKEQGEIALEHNTAPETLRPAMDRLMTMRRARFEAIGRPGMTPLWRDFYHALAARPDRTLGISVTTMAVSGEAVATCFGLARNDTYHAILPTFAVGKWEGFRPGLLLFDAMIAMHAEQTPEEGYFDFTIGDEVYKKRFGSESHPLYEWMTPRTVAGLAVYAYWRMKIFLRDRYPRLFALAKRIVNRFR